MTARETIIKATIDALKEAPGMPPVERSIGRAYLSDEMPVVAVHRGQEVADYRVLGVVDRTCHVMVSVLSRSDDPEVQSDEIHALAFPIVMAMAGNNIREVREIGTMDPDYGSFDPNVCRITMRYEVIYRTATNTL